MTSLGSQDRALLPLRAFLGFTFCFAGLQKLANRAFFNAANPASIQAQLAASARRSPIHALVTPLGHVAVAVGLLIAFGELAVGIGTLLGLWSRVAAAGGMVLSLMLFLTVSFHTSPYYTGADIVFLFAWTPLLLGTPSAWTLDAVLAEHTARAERAGEEQAARARRTSAAGPRQAKAAEQAAPVWGGRSPAQARRQAATSEDDTRREAMLKGVVTAGVALGALIIGGLTAAVGRLASKNTNGGGAEPALSGSPTSSSSGASGASGTSGASGKAIGSAASVPIGGAATFTDPGTGDPAVVVHPGGNTFLGFDAVCPHAGCTVQYDQSQVLFVCPCHGSQFNASTGAVEQGPATSGLRTIPVTRGQGDQLYVT